MIFMLFSFFFFFTIFYCALGSGVHVQIMQDCCIGTYMAVWFAASIPTSPISGISPHVIPHQLPYPLFSSPYSLPTDPSVWCSPFCVDVFSLFNAHLWVREHAVFVFYLCISLLRMMVSRFIHVPAKEIQTHHFLWLHSIPWHICATFSLSSLSSVGAWVGSRSLLL